MDLQVSGESEPVDKCWQNDLTTEGPVENFPGTNGQMHTDVPARELLNSGRSQIEPGDN
jgi:hypothetical protein